MNDREFLERYAPTKEEERLALNHFIEEQRPQKPTGAEAKHFRDVFKKEIVQARFTGAMVALLKSGRVTVTLSDDGQDVVWKVREYDHTDANITGGDEEFLDQEILDDWLTNEERTLAAKCFVENQPNQTVTDFEIAYFLEVFSKKIHLARVTLTTLNMLKSGRVTVALSDNHQHLRFRIRQ